MAKCWKKTFDQYVETLPKKWDTFSAVAACEGFDGQDHSEEEIYSAWQYLIDTGTCWKLQGWFGRTAVDMIRAGHCHHKETA